MRKLLFTFNCIVSSPNSVEIVNIKIPWSCVKIKTISVRNKNIVMEIFR